MDLENQEQLIIKAKNGSVKIRLAVHILNLELQIEKNQRDPLQNRSVRQRIQYLLEHLRSCPERNQLPLLEDKFKIIDSLMHYDVAKRTYSFHLRLNKLLDKKSHTIYLLGEEGLTLTLPQNVKKQTWDQLIREKSSYERFQFDPLPRKKFCSSKFLFSLHLKIKIQKKSNKT